MAKEKIKNNNGENTNNTLNRQEGESSQFPQEVASFLKGFVLMPFGDGKEEKKPESSERDTPSNKKPTDKIDNETQVLTKEHQNNLFWILIFAMNDAFYRNFLNKTVHIYKPINLERADTGASLSDDLLDNIFLKIGESDFCLADITGKRPNVFLEVGYALARDRYIAQIVQGDMVKGDLENISDLAGKLYYKIESKKLFEMNIWRNHISKAEKFSEIIEKPTEFFNDFKKRKIPLPDDKNGRFRSLLGVWIKENVKGVGEDKNLRKDLDDFEKEYWDKIVKELYRTICPLWKKIYSGSTEVRYTCEVFASREAAEFDSVFSSAKKSIKILTTNLEGLVKYIPGILSAASNNNATVYILTLDPESEFVNARGTLIGKEVWEFRKEMKESLNKFIEAFKSPDDSKKCSGEVDNNPEDADRTNKKSKDKPKIFIRIYREFPTQITYIVDDYIYSNVVSVNHQSRNNIVFKIKEDRKGVENSFLQHWDTIWARAHNVQATISF